MLGRAPSTHYGTVVLFFFSAHLQDVIAMRMGTDPSGLSLVDRQGQGWLMLVWDKRVAVWDVDYLPKYHYPSSLISGFTSYLFLLVPTNSPSTLSFIQLYYLVNLRLLSDNTVVFFAINLFVQTNQPKSVKMQFKNLAFSLFVAAATADTLTDLVMSIPSCALTCLVTSASNIGCGVTDYSCQCNKAAALQSDAQSCVAAACSTADQASTS